MVAAASVRHGRQRESVYCPRRWCLCAWRRLPRSRSETVEDGAGEEALCTTTMVDRLQCGVRGRRCGSCATVDECADVEGEEHEGCGAVEKSILRWVQKMGSIQVYYSRCWSVVGWVG